jgi:broad specificity phosphatase PhoE
MEKQKYCTIYIVRHGETRANFEKVVAGHFDSPLTAKGEGEAKSRAEDLKRIRFDAVFSSDLMRAKRTAEIITLGRQLAVNTTRLIRERNFGDWEGRPIKEVLEEDKKILERLSTLSEQGKRAFKINYGYESDNDIALRLITFLREIAATFMGQTVLVVVHGSIMRATLMHLGFANYDELPPGSIENTGYAVLQSDGVDFFIKETKGVNKAKAN